LTKAFEELKRDKIVYAELLRLFAQAKASR